MWNGDIKATTKVHENEKADCDATRTGESVDALACAIAVLKKQAHDRKQASLVQFKTRRTLMRV